MSERQYLRQHRTIPSVKLQQQNFRSVFPWFGLIEILCAMFQAFAANCAVLSLFLQKEF